VKFSLSIYDPDKELSITIKNLDLELLQEISKEESIEVILANKYYMYGVYDKMDLLGNNCMILKSTKKSVELLMI
jgi:hypothetical protein